jgi:hypothetical protein
MILTIALLAYIALILSGVLIGIFRPRTPDRWSYYWYKR